MRLGKGRDDWAIEIEGIVPMLSRGRPMQGWLRCNPNVYSNSVLRQKLLSHAIEFVRSLPGG